MADSARRINNFYQVMREPDKNIFSISSDEDFIKKALEIFMFQAVHNPIYSNYIKSLGIDFHKIDNVQDIPFLPIQFFKEHKIKTTAFQEELVFYSSGTSGMSRSKHLIRDTGLYEDCFNNCFRLFYDDPANYAILALLPSYSDRDTSSLVFMVDRLIKQSRYKESGFYSDDPGKLHEVIISLKEQGAGIILIGVSFALLDLFEKYKIDLSGQIIMETGGMKGRRKEMVREEMHSILKEGFNVDSVHSEYGMTELLSQAYSDGDGLFSSPPWMKILIRDTLDPFSILPPGRTGGVNIIDLANIYSCSFIETSDLGILHDDASFEITGRFDNSDIRGCNLLAL